MCVPMDVKGRGRQFEIDRGCFSPAIDSEWNVLPCPVWYKERNKAGNAQAWSM